MSGLFLLGVLALWLVLVVWMARLLTKSIKREWLQVISLYAAIVLIFPLIVIDELITAPQFKKLCEEGTKLTFDPEKIRGKTIFLDENPQPDISVGLLRGYYIPWRYLDATTKETLISYNSYHIKGGLLIRMLGISETTAPLTMRRYCSTNEHPDQKNFLDRYNLKYIDRKHVK